MVTVELHTTRSLEHFATSWRNLAPHTKEGQRKRYETFLIVHLMTSKHQVDEKSARVHDSKASLLGLPDASFVIYLSLNCIVWVLIWQEASGGKQPNLNPHLLAFLASIGPVGLAQLIVWIQDPRRPVLYPFQRQALHQTTSESDDRNILLITGTPLGRLHFTLSFHCFSALDQSMHWYLLNKPLIVMTVLRNNGSIWLNDSHSQSHNIPVLHLNLISDVPICKDLIHLRFTHFFHLLAMPSFSG